MQNHGRRDRVSKVSPLVTRHLMVPSETKWLPNAFLSSISRPLVKSSGRRGTRYASVSSPRQTKPNGRRAWCCLLLGCSYYRRKVSSFVLTISNYAKRDTRHVTQSIDDLRLGDESWLWVRFRLYSFWLTPRRLSLGILNQRKLMEDETSVRNPGWWTDNFH